MACMLMFTYMHAIILLLFFYTLLAPSIDMGGAPRRHSAHIAPLGNTLHVVHVAILTMCSVLQFAAMCCSACRGRIVDVCMRGVGAAASQCCNT